MRLAAICIGGYDIDTASIRAAHLPDECQVVWDVSASARERPLRQPFPRGKAR